jgi:hypothetical protein
LRKKFIMLRDKGLIPLSRQHQHALALCVRIERASPTMSLSRAKYFWRMMRRCPSCWFLKESGPLPCPAKGLP